MLQGPDRSARRARSALVQRADGLSWLNARPRRVHRAGPSARSATLAAARFGPVPRDPAVASSAMLQLLDLAGIYFRAFFAVPTSMTSPDGRPVNAVRGSLDILAKVITDAGPTRVIACLDLDWRPAWRVELIPSYKTHRVLEPQSALSANAVEPAANPAQRDTRRLHRHRGGAGRTVARRCRSCWTCWPRSASRRPGAPGFEADDVIGTLAATERTDPVEVVTGDRDLFQVARDTDPAVRVRYIGAGMSKAAGLLGRPTSPRKYGIPPGGYADFAALRGDPSDGLPGVPGRRRQDRRHADQPVRLGRGTGRGDRRPVHRADRRDAGQAGRRPRLPAGRAEGGAGGHRRPGERRPRRERGRCPGEPVDPGRLSELIRLHGIGGATARLVNAIENR